MQPRRILFTFLLVVVLCAGAFFPLRWLSPHAKPVLLSKITTVQLREIQFGAVRKFQLPPGRLPNAITVATDGSVWFGEQALPGVGHLYPNGTLIEYTWPFKYHWTDIWGVAVWNGAVWCTDPTGNQLVGLDPVNGNTETVRLPVNESFPYTLTVGPENSLWFTEVFSKIGRLDPALNLYEYPTPVVGTPGQIVFVNSTLGYYVEIAALGPVSLSGIFVFNPTDPEPYKIGGDEPLYSPTSLALGNGGIWLTQHLSSIIAFYDLSKADWVLYPTSTISYWRSTLPYFVATNGSLVWFNEHYANKMAVLNSETGLLTEYSLSDPPAGNITEIDNALTFALGKNRVWFTELTANYVGFLGASYRPNFTLTPLGNEILNVERGGSINMTLAIHGSSTIPLSIQFSDTEDPSTSLQNITANPSLRQIDSLNGQVDVSVLVTAETTIKPGDYTLLITVTDGLVSQGAYVRLSVSDS